jgi:hypothetical protein
MHSAPFKWRVFGLLALLVAAMSAAAHPGVGIVQDQRGIIYFTDLKQVWKIAPDGKMSVAVPGVHSHELCLDVQDSLFGEHLWGENGQWRHRVWRLNRDGTVSDVIPQREGFLKDYSFVRDRDGNMYWADRGTKTSIKKRSPDGKIVTHATGDFRAVGWMSATPDGKLFLIDAGDLRRIGQDGKVTTIATKLSEHQPPPAKVSDLNYHMGLWTDANGVVYVAVAQERLVLQVQADGQIKVFARSKGDWSPSGGMFDRDGNLWLLEFDSTNAVRARRIDREGHEQVFPAASRGSR